MEEPNYPAWMNDELVSDIPKEKLEFLGSVFSQSKGKTQKELMQYMMLVMRKAKEQSLTFSTIEMNSAIAAIRKHSAPEELKQIDHLLAKAKNGGT